MAIYISRQNKVENNVLMVLTNLIKSRVVTDFNYFKAMNDLLSFEMKWCCKEALCSVREGMVVFASFFLQ